MKSKKERARRSKLKWPLFALATPIFALIGVVTFLFWSTRGLVYTRLEEVPDEPIAIVFGAGLRNGEPSPALQGRLDGSIQLYRQRKVKKLLMSGDNRTRYYNEPAAMRKYAVRHGVPAADILMDFAGSNTYDTCYRASKVFGLHSAVLVTQAYHAPRAAYLARAMGMNVVAYAVPNLDRYPIAQLGYTGREYLADAKAVWDASVTHRKPHFDAEK